MVGIGDDCDPGQAWPSPVPPYNTFGGACWWPATLTIDVGDRVYFYQYAENFFTGPHNVVADDGSFRCARGCYGEGGDGTPGSDSKCLPNGDCGYDLSKRISFYRDFTVPGIVKYHDEVTGAPGVIYVGVSPPASLPNAIGSGHTGTWFNSGQSGMGFMLEVLPGPPMQMLAAWLTFSPAGGPSWIVGLGPVANNQATLQATQIVGSGARFPPSFDPSNIQTQSWGALTFTFSDCNHGHVDWSSSIPEYVSGGMDLTRLTQPAGVACSGGAMVRPASGSASQ